MKNNTLRPLLAALLGIFMLSLFMLGCKKPSDEIGSDIGVVDGNISSSFLDTFSIKAFTVRDDSVRTDRRTPAPFGSFFDPYFGVTTSSMFVNFVATSIFSSGLVVTQPDSAVLHIRYASPSHFGKIGKYNGIIKITAYRLTEKMVVQSTSEAGYSSKKEFAYNPIPVGSAVLVPNPYDSVSVNGIKEAPQVRIKLSQAFANELLTADPMAFSSADAFAEYFKGFYLKVEPVSNFGNVGSGGFIYLDPSSAGSRLNLYYNDTSRLSFPIQSDNSVWTTFHQHDYSSAVNLFGSTDGEDVLLVQPLSGTKVQVHIPYIEEFNSDKSIGINKAELVFPVYDSYVGQYPLPARLFLSRKSSEDGKLYNLVDYIQSSGANGGTYDSDKKEYRFNITLHMQAVMSGVTTNDTLVLESLTKQTEGNRAPLFGTQNNLGRVKLRVYYTKLK